MVSLKEVNFVWFFTLMLIYFLFHEKFSVYVVGEIFRLHEATMS